MYFSIAFRAQRRAAWLMEIKSVSWYKLEWLSLHTGWELITYKCVSEAWHKLHSVNASAYFSVQTRWKYVAYSTFLQKVKHLAPGMCCCTFQTTYPLEGTISIFVNLKYLMLIHNSNKALFHSLFEYKKKFEKVEWHAFFEHSNTPPLW